MRSNCTIDNPLSDDSYMCAATKAIVHAVRSGSPHETASSSSGSNGNDAKDPSPISLLTPKQMVNALQESCFIPLLASMLSNDSLLEIELHTDLYVMLFRVSTCMVIVNINICVHIHIHGVRMMSSLPPFLLQLHRELHCCCLYYRHSRHALLLPLLSTQSTCITIESVRWTSTCH